MTDHNTRGRVDITTRCRPDYSKPDPDATIYGFLINYADEQIELWAANEDQFFWKEGLADYDYPKVFENFKALSSGRSNLGKMLKPAFKYAEDHEQPIYVNGVICTCFSEKEIPDNAATSG